MFRKIRSVLFILFLASGTALFGQNKNNDVQLAKVLILPFSDNTGSKDYRYLSGSLVDAVGNAMRKEFEYERISMASVKSLHNYEEEVLTDKDIKGVAKLVNADIVIYGTYSFDPETELMSFSVDIYFPTIGEKKSLEPVTNPIDNTLFAATDTVAASIVLEINNTIVAHEEKIAQKESVKKGEEPVEKTGGKKKLTMRALDARKQMSLKFSGASGFASPLESLGYWYQVEIFEHGEKFYSNWFSTYGTLGVGYVGVNYPLQDYASDGYSLRIPIFSPLIVFSAIYSLIAQKPMPPLGAFPLVEGVGIHLRKPGAQSWLGFHTGLYTAIMYSETGVFGFSGYLDTTIPILAMEAGVRLYIKKKTVISITSSIGFPYFIGARIGAAQNF